jgi:hypothetical protein
MRETTLNRLKMFVDTFKDDVGGLGIHCRYDDDSEGGFWYAMPLDPDLDPIHEFGGRVYPSSEFGSTVLDDLSNFAESLGLSAYVADYGGKSFTFEYV